MRKVKKSVSYFKLERRYQHNYKACSVEALHVRLGYSDRLHINLIAYNNNNMHNITSLKSFHSVILDYRDILMKVNRNAYVTNAYLAELAVVKQPIYGRLISAEFNSQVLKFRLNDVVFKQIYYQSDDGLSYDDDDKTDNFIILFSNSSNNLMHRQFKNACSLELFNFSVKQASHKSKLRLTIGNKSLVINTDQRYASINETMLNVGEEEKVRFVVVQSPVWGRIVRASNLRKIRNQFQQQKLFKSLANNFTYTNPVVEVGDNKNVRPTPQNNVNPRSHHQKFHHRTLSTFSYSDFKSGKIFYLLGSLNVGRGIEKLTDSFRLYATNDISNSTIGQIFIDISVPNQQQTLIKKRNNRNANHLQLVGINKKRKNKVLGAAAKKNKSNIHPLSLYKHDAQKSQMKKKSGLVLKVENIIVPRGGRKQFVVSYYKPTQKRRSMFESKLFLDRPPSHGHLILLNPSKKDQKGRNIRSSLNYNQNENSALPALRNSRERNKIFNNLTNGRLRPGSNNYFHDIKLMDSSNKIRLLYNHDGSDSDEDNFILSLLNDLKNIKKTVNVRVAQKTYKPVNRKTVVINDLIIRKDQSTTLNTSYIFVNDSSLQPHEIEYEMTRLPARGYLKVLHQNIDTDGYLTGSPMQINDHFSQVDLIENKVLYVYTHEGTEDDSWEFKVNGDKLPFVINVSVLNASVDRVNYSLIIDSEDLVDCWNMEDVASYVMKKLKHCLQWKLSKPPSNGQVGHFSDKQHFVGSVNFDNSKICYKLTSKSTFKDEFEMRVDACNKFEILTINVFVELDKRISDMFNMVPVLKVNLPLMVKHGKLKEIGNSNLRAESSLLNASQVVYTIVNPPVHGNILLRGVPACKFSQEDVNMKEVQYQSVGIDTMEIDSFSFNIITENSMEQSELLNNLTKSKSEFVFTVLIQKIMWVAANVIHHDVVQLSGRYIFKLNSTYLKVSHSSSRSQDLVFHIKNETQHGHLKNQLTGKHIRKKFTQKDIDDGKLIYALMNSSSGTSDSFTFYAADNDMNVIDNLTFVFQWSLINFQHERVKVCKHSKNASLPILREGYLDSQVVVDIQTKPLTRKRWTSYGNKVTNSTVVMQPGMASVNWFVLLNVNTQKDKEDVFKVAIASASKSIIGPRYEVVVQMLGQKEEPCVNDDTSLLIADPKEDFQVITDEEDLYSTDIDESYENYEGSEEIDDEEDEEDDDELDEVKAPRKKENLGNGGYLREDLSYYNEETANVKRQTNQISLKINNKPELPLIKEPCDASRINGSHVIWSTWELFRCNGKRWVRIKLEEQPKVKGEKEIDSVDNEKKLCPSGWYVYGDHCFFFSSVKMSWTDSRDECVSEGGKLTFIRDRGHLSWLSNMNNREAFWIGLSNHKEKRRWEYLLQGDPANTSPYLNWAPGKPCTDCSRFRCAIVNRKQQFTDRHCYKDTARYVCASGTKPKRHNRRNSQKLKNANRQTKKYTNYQKYIGT
ncbi:hypothetical protein HELRODRAFT_192404 [Helobdella robusta]|uniref:C-type lectin domain-containing protein n=1 Tax=Helobdella robusta TaxID=6412 RepID=T1FTX0_HELRO|nr:hypothetical protein HELRODRAFT_192404 [Helobdella robusta]ESO00757.1 hypothetical protein HELRODRAFT_192404 [Helobdella robusta]